LANWSGKNAGQLATLLKAGDSAGFDRALLDYTVSQQGKQAVFGHVVHVFEGREPPPLTAEWDAPPALAEAVQIRLRQGDRQRIVRLNPQGKSVE
jgi:hypothetical protein